ncbi:MAG TPA: response regulator [Sedimenticola thiotaurini]|uniref:Response regulator n=1 Tax=Sedimenticola thiotaurini TaxID=1543721 RepID=A0A831RMW5_9GAMM|nr:response regulator [Sedimenticola thiotaurini]
MDSTGDPHTRHAAGRHLLQRHPAIALTFGVLLGLSGPWLGLFGVLLVTLVLLLLMVFHRLIRQHHLTGEMDDPTTTPFPVAAALPDGPASAPEPETTTGEHLAAGEREAADAAVLLLADDVAALDDLHQWLASWNIPFQTASRVGEALHLLLQGERDGTPYRAAIVNEGRLGIGSDQFAALVRSEPELRHLPLIHIASTGALQRSQLEAAGYSCLLGRPLDKTLLYNALHEPLRPYPDSDTRVVRLIDRYTSPVSRQPLHILLADSDGSDRHRIRNLLKRMGHEVFVADDGIHVLDALDGHRFDLAIVSLDLNRASGLETFKLHRFSRVGNRRVPFIILLEQADSALLRRCETAGVDGMLIKPLDGHKLSTTIERIMELPLGSHTGDAGRGDGGPPKARGIREIQGVLLDIQRLTELDRLGGSSDFLEKLVSGFRIEGRRLVLQLEEAARRCDHHHFRDLSQALSDLAGNVGAFELHRASIAAGRIDPHDFPSVAGGRTADIRSIHENTERALRAFLSEYTGSGHRGTLD